MVRLGFLELNAEDDNPRVGIEFVRKAAQTPLGKALDNDEYNWGGDAQIRQSRTWGRPGSSNPRGSNGWMAACPVMVAFRCGADFRTRLLRESRFAASAQIARTSASRFTAYASSQQTAASHAADA
jgi:hypothetical protein